MGSFADFKKKVAIQGATDIPQAVVKLPSNGKRATIRSMKVKEQKEFLKAFEKQDEFLLNEAFDHILAKCVDSIEGDAYDGDVLCVQDRTFLLIKIRQLTSGDKIKIPHFIQEKNKVEQVEVDLSQFAVVYHEGDVEQEIVLSDNVKVIVGPVSRKNEKDMEQYLKKKGTANKDSVIERRYCAYAAIIKEIWYTETKDDKKETNKVDASFGDTVEFITDFNSDKDLKKLDEYVATLDFGIKLKFPVSIEGYQNDNEEASVLSFFII